MLIRKVIIPEERIEELVHTIQQKQELRDVREEFIRDQLFYYLERDPSAARLLATAFSRRSARYKKIVKKVRATLRKSYGQYRIAENIKKRQELVRTLHHAPPSRQKEIIISLLHTHSSTAERLPFYEKLYQKIFAITGKPASIIDLGCGINPFSLPFMGLDNVDYYAYDLSEEDIDALTQFFRWMRQKKKDVRGKAEILDVTRWIQLLQLPPADVCFLFKMTEVLDRGKGHKATEIVVRDIPARFVIVSFATKTLGGKSMTAPRRRWMEWLCRRLEYKYHLLEFENEIFYVIEKES